MVGKRAMAGGQNAGFRGTKVYGARSLRSIKHSRPGAMPMNAKITAAVKLASDVNPVMGRGLFGFLLKAKDFDLAPHEIEAAFAVYQKRSQVALGI